MWPSAHDALKWAYQEVEKPLVQLSGINGMRGPYRTTRNELLIGLTPSERRDQAVDIIALGAGLRDAASGEYLAAMYGRRIEPKYLRTILNRVFAALGTGMHNRKAVSTAVCMYFGKNRSYRVVRRILKCDDSHALRMCNRVWDALDVIHTRAMADISECMERHHLIQVAAYA